MKHYLSFALAVLSITTATSQTNDDEKPVFNTFVLPDGQYLNPDNLDSLEIAWGKGRVLFRHSEEDDKEGIMRLERKTDSQIEKDQAEEQMLATMTGMPAPQFELTDQKGRKWSLRKLKGNVVVLNFWHTSCAPCIREIPELNKLAVQYENKDVVFLALCHNTKEQIRAFLTKHDFQFTLLPDAKSVNQVFNINSWPITMVIDKNGYIRYVQDTGKDIYANLNSEISKAL